MRKNRLFLIPAHERKRLDHPLRGELKALGLGHDFFDRVPLERQESELVAAMVLIVDELGQLSDADRPAGFQERSIARPRTERASPAAVGSRHFRRADLDARQVVAHVTAGAFCSRRRGYGNRRRASADASSRFGPRLVVGRIGGVLDALHHLVEFGVSVGIREAAVAGGH